MRTEFVALFLSCTCFFAAIHIAVVYALNEHKWKKLLRYLSPYYNHFSVYLKLKGYIKGGLYSLSEIYKCMVDYMESEGIITTEYNALLYQLIANAEKYTYFVECSDCKTKLRYSHRLACIDNLFKINEVNISLD